MGWLTWEEERGAFVGQWLQVSAHAFQAAVDTAVATGEPEHEAVLRLLQEEAWWWTDAGVSVLPTGSERVRRLLPERRQRPH
jgi:hypothetical protein